MAELISTKDCVKILTRFSEKDNAEDIKLVRYMITANELIVKIKYRTVDLKCSIDKLSFADGEVGEVKSLEQFVNFYLKPPMPVLEILGDEDSKERPIKLSITSEEPIARQNRALKEEFMSEDWKAKLNS